MTSERDPVRRWLDAPGPHLADPPPGLEPLVRGLAAAGPSDLSRNDHPAVGPSPRQAAVLVLLGHGDAGPDVLLQRRAGGLRHHPGEVSFPGGRRDDHDPDPVATALREAAEETGLDPAGVDPLLRLPRLELLTGFHVTAVLAHWRAPTPVAPADRAETAEVARTPLASLADPAARLVVDVDGRWLGPAFAVGGMLVWGFTAEILDAVLRTGGWERPWTPGTPVDLRRAWELARS